MERALSTVGGTVGPKDRKLVKTQLGHQSQSSQILSGSGYTVQENSATKYSFLSIPSFLDQFFHVNLRR